LALKTKNYTYENDTEEEGKSPVRSPIEKMSLSPKKERNGPKEGGKKKEV
jgi:hypothetical protein